MATGGGNGVKRGRTDGCSLLKRETLNMHTEPYGVTQHIMQPCNIRHSYVWMSVGVSMSAGRIYPLAFRQMLSQLGGPTALQHYIKHCAAMSYVAWLRLSTWINMWGILWLYQASYLIVLNIFSLQLSA